MTPRFIIIDPSLIDYGGHFYSLDMSMALAARAAGLEPVVFAHATLASGLDRRGITITPWFNRPMWEFVAETPSDPGSFSAMIQTALSSIGITSPEHVLVPTAGGRDLEDVLHAMQRMDARRQPTWHILLHYSPGDGPMNLARQAPLAQVMEQMSATGRVRFYGIVPAIAEMYRPVTAAPVQPAHLPVGLVNVPAPYEGSTPRPLHVVMLGSARPAKGYSAIPDLVTRVYPEVLSGRFRFTIHAVRRRSDPVAALDALHTYADPNVRLIRDILSSPAYFALLASADIVLVPYQAHYTIAGSGVLPEALIAGKPIILPAAMPQGHDIGPDQKYCLSDAGELPDALRRVADDFPRYAAAARAAAPFWRERHSPERLLRAMLAP